MPSQQSHLTALEADGHKIEGWLFLFARNSAVAVYDVDTTPVFPAYDLDVTLDSGASANVKQGALYTVETAGGLFKGMGRIRYAGTISDSNLPVRELSRGSIDVASGDVVRVYRYFLPGDKLVGATIDFNPDGLSYTDQGSNPPPIGNNGGGWAGFSSQLPFALNDSLGYVVDPDSSSAVTVVRTLPSGLSYASGNDTTLDVTITGDPGTYWIETVVTDPDNSKSVTRYTPVCIDDTPLDCTIDPYGGDIDNGWRMTVNFRESVSIEEGTIAAFVAKETIDGVQGSFGSASEDRSHIKFFGIVRRLTAAGDGTGVNTVGYEFISPLAWLLETPGFSKVMLDTASPASWMQMKTLDTKRAKLQIIQFYSNLNQVGYDLAFTSNYRNKRYPGIFLDKNTPIAQLRELADGVGARLACNRQGRFEFFTRPRFEPLADRSSIPTMLTPTADGILRYQITQELKPTIEKSYFLGFIAGASGNAPFRIAFPGKAPGTGTLSPNFEKMICDSILDAEEEAGRRGALVEQVYVRSTGERLWGIAVELTLFGSFDVFDLYGEWVGLPALTNVANIDTSAYRYEIESIGVEYSDGTGRVTLRLLSETNAPPGQYDPPPPDEGFSFPDWTWDYGDPIGIPPQGALLSGVGDKFVTIDTGGSLFYTLSRGQVWAEIALSPTGTILDFISDPRSPVYMGTGVDLWLHVLTSTRVAKVVFNTATQTVTSYTNNESHTAAPSGRIEMSRAVPNLIVAVLTIAATSTVVIRTTDGTTWGSPVTINASGSSYGAPGLFASDNRPPRVYTGEATTGATAQGKVSNDGGATFANLTTVDIDAAGSCFALHVPFNDNADTIMYFGEYAGNGNPRLFTRAVGGTQTDISPQDGGESWGAQLGRATDSSPLNRRLMAACLRNGTATGAPNDDVRVYYTTDDWATNNFIAALDGLSDNATAYWFVRFAGDMPLFYVLGDAGRIAAADLTGVYEDLSGNLAALGAARLLNLCGF